MKQNLFLLAGFLGIFLFACNTIQKPIEKTILIGPSTQPCTAGVMQTECMQVKWTKDQGEWENFFGEIEGFAFERGFEYELLVTEEKVENPPAGASSLKYKLLKEVAKTKVDLPNAAMGDNSRNALDWAGTYEGELPCADCDGIKTIITLNSDGTFTKSEEYLGKNGKPFADKGNFEWNPEGSIISLTGSNNSIQKYQVGENQLFHLDISGNRITGNLADKYILVKKGNETTTSKAGFEDKKWKLVNFMGKEIKEDEAEYYITFNSKDKRMSTKVGCNVMNAGYEIKNELELKFGPMMSSMMACPDKSIEEEYSKNLETVNNITTNGEQLQLNRARMTIATYKLVN